MSTAQPDPFGFDDIEIEDQILLDETQILEDGFKGEWAVLPVRDTVIYPQMVSPLFVGRERSVKSIEAAMKADEALLVVTQKDSEETDPIPTDLYAVGTLVNIGRVLKMPDGTTSILGQGHARVKIEEWLDDGEHLRARGTIVQSDEAIETTDEALRRAVLSLFERCVRLNDNLPEDAYVAAMNAETPGWLADLIASMMEFPVPQRQELLEVFDPTQRLQRLSLLLAQELDLLELEDKIQTQVQDEMDKTQREYFLREQLRVIQTELGEGDPFMSDVKGLNEKIVNHPSLPAAAREKATRELHRLETMPAAAPEVGIIRTYLDWILELPWGSRSDDNLDLQNAEKVLASNHYGLPKIKDRILEYIAVRKLAQSKMRSPILCFVGPPGTGKTSLGRSIADALGRKFVRVSLGGLHDEAEIRGHRRTYIGALPGRIIQGMRTAGTSNPVFMLDEIDKVGMDFRGDPSAALLEALDPEQNKEFSDHYLDLPYDLSQVMFITTANVLYTVPDALLDRMEVIEFSGYTEEEKLEIAHTFMVPRLLTEHGLPEKSLTFSDTTLKKLVREYTMEAGVRNLEREIARLCRKAARTVAEGKDTPKVISTAVVEKWLGPPQFEFGAVEKEDEVGVAMGVAVTGAGGDLLPIEVIVMEGRGSLMLTGQLGEVMQESAHAALSYARANAKQLGVQFKDFDKIDIHIHLPEGAVPKDGPSAGITMATALISALTRRPVRRDVAMTGEITLRGRILPIGGFKEKVLAAHRAGIKTFFAPAKNRKDLVDVSRKVQRALAISFVERMDEVLDKVLMDALKPASTNSTAAKKSRARPAIPPTNTRRKPPKGRRQQPPAPPAL